ncbi:hypothetical protein REPUB_Repub01dG0229400 [Reevesia pubescens]
MFLWKNEMTRAIRALKGAWLWDYKLGVNPVRFNARSKFWRKVNVTEKHDCFSSNENNDNCNMEGLEKNVKNSKFSVEL